MKLMQQTPQDSFFPAELLAQIEEIMVVSSPDGRVLYWNASAERFWGISAAQIVGQPLQNFLEYDWLSDADREECQAALRRDGFWRGYTTCRIPERGEWELNSSIKVVRDADGQITGYLSLTHSIAERGQNNERQSRTVLLEASASERQTGQDRHWEIIGSVAGGIAHELNSLFTAILGYAELAKGALPPASKPAEDLTRLQSAAQQAARLTRQMLDYSGQGLTRLQSVDVNALVRERTGERANAPMNVSLVTKLDPNLPQIQADPRRLGHVLSALLTNALEAIETETGFLTVTTCLLSADDAALAALNLSGLPSGEYLHLSVADTGHGMDGETLARIFEPFFSTKFTGRGLGLAAAQGIVRSHKGGLSAESRLGSGSTFHLLLPLNP